jgi:hypothetical protein
MERHGSQTFSVVQRNLGSLNSLCVGEWSYLEIPVGLRLIEPCFHFGKQGS